MLYPNSHSSWNLTFTKFVPFRAIQPSDLSTPVYETPPSMYSAEGIMKILLNPNIPAERVCQKCPSFVTRSSTFVIDVTSLAHCDDVKKDDFGRWEHKGSHPIPFYEWFRDDGSVGVERCQDGGGKGEVFYLRRVYCTHPSNNKMKRLLAFVTGKLKVHCGGEGLVSIWVEEGGYKYVRIH